MIVFSDDTHIERMLGKKANNATIYLIHHGDKKVDVQPLKFAHFNKIKKINEITVNHLEGTSIGVAIAKMIFAEKHFAGREKIIYDFGEIINDEIFYILNPGKHPKKHAAKYDDQYKDRLVEQWISKKKPPKSSFAKQNGISPSAFSDWIKKWEQKNKIIPQIFHVDEDSISYYDNNGAPVPYYFSIDFHSQLHELVNGYNLNLTDMEICVLENILLSYGQIPVSEDNCTYEQHTQEEFIDYMHHYTLSDRIKTHLPDSVLADLWKIREYAIQTLKVQRRTSI